LSSIYQWLASEENGRAIGSAASIFAIVGLIIPGFIAILNYVYTSRRIAQDKVLEFLAGYTSRENHRDRNLAYDLLEKYNAGKLTREDLAKDADKAAILTRFLNENELLAIFVMAEGRNSFRARLARKYIGSTFLNGWEMASRVVDESRRFLDDSTAYEEFEKLARLWTRQKSS
jgi:Domain of unknown function (DUF4760)